MKKTTRQIGTLYEEKTALYLSKQGIKITEKNFTCKYGEIDLIGKDGDYIVFIEVKYRKNNAAGGPSYAVDHKKQNRICRAADVYLLKNGYGFSLPCRFDVVLVTGERMEYIKNAFDYIRKG